MTDISFTVLFFAFPPLTLEPKINPPPSQTEQVNTDGIEGMKTRRPSTRIFVEFIKGHEIGWCIGGQLHPEKDQRGVAPAYC
jgi:hypothetical protein